MKICFLTELNPHDNRSWSGILFQMFNHLKKYHEVEWIGAVRFSLIQKFLLKSERFYNKYIIRKIPLQSELFGRLYAKNIKIKINTSLYDYIYAPAASNLFSFLQTNIPIIYASDATFELMINYYPEFTGLSKKMISDGNTIERNAITRADKILYCSDWAKDSAIKYYKASPQKIFVQEFGANLLQTPSLNDLNFNDSYICNMVFLGVNWERKGGDIAYKTYLLLKQKGFACTFTIVGCNPVLPAIDKDVTIVPFLNKNDKKDFDIFYNILLKTHFIILPSKAECFGIVFCEASAFGIPSLSARTGGIPSAIHDNVNGFLLDATATENDYAKKIETIFNNKPAYKALRMAARKDFETRLTWDKWAEKFNEIL